MLQKHCEKFQFSNLITNLIFKESNEASCLKLASVAAFIVSELSLNINRILKPFNPILGETFEYFDNDKKFRYLAEQVSHNPPITAYICESEEFVIFADTRCKSKFKILKGAMEINFLNRVNIMFKASNQHFRYKLPTMFLKGLIYGTPHYDYEGVCEITSHKNSNGNKAVLEFFEEGWSKPLGSVEGKILNEKGEISYFLKGQWNYGLYLIEANGKDISILKNIDIKNINNNNDGLKITELWRIDENEDYYKKLDNNNYKLSKYAYNLNNLDEGLIKVLPKCDSRLRPDQRLLENRIMDKAEEGKKILEENQRQRHKEFERNKIKYEPSYFSEILDDKSKELIYLYKGGYWEDRTSNNFSRCHDIFN